MKLGSIIPLTPRVTDPVAARARELARRGLSPEQIAEHLHLDSLPPAQAAHARIANRTRRKKENR